MNKEDTLQAIIDQYELSNFNGRTTRALNHVWDKSRQDCKRIITKECNSLRDRISELERSPEDWESEIEDYNMMLRATFRAGEML